MTEPQISPLARRLAEENSIDWRVIPGTGPESRVIERDILTYLARIMSGEIDPPALPDASEPPVTGSTAPDLSEVSNLAAASAGMAKEGIDLSSLLGGATPVAASSFGFAASPPISAAPTPATPIAVAFMPVVPEPIETPALQFQAPSAETSPATPAPLDFTFSNEPVAPAAVSDHASLEQISFGDPIAAPADFEPSVSFGDPVVEDAMLSAPAYSAPVFGDPTPSVPNTKGSSADSFEAEFEIDLDDLDDAPAALEVIEPASSVAEISVPEFGATSGNFAETSGSVDYLAVLESPTSPDLTFSPARSDLSADQMDLVLDIDSTSEKPLTIAALDARSEIDDDLVIADASTDDSDPVLDISPPVEAFALEPVQAEPVHPEPIHADSIKHDDFELDLLETESIGTGIVDTGSVSTDSITPAHLLAKQPAAQIPSEPSIAAPVSQPPAPLEPALLEPALPANDAVAAVPPAASQHIAQPEGVSATQTSSAVSTGSVATGFFQGFAVRRHFDAAPLTKMQQELTLALNGREAPLAVFLARAAQRNLHALGIGDVVTLTRLGDSLEPLQASGLHHSFIEAVQSVARATPGKMEGLLVLDASSLGADDLVLPGAGPVLTLNVKGDHGHLALSGDVPMSKAADFLGKIAQALETPVSLVI